MQKRLRGSIAGRFGITMLAAVIVLLSVYGYFDYRDNHGHALYLLAAVCIALLSTLLFIHWTLQPLRQAIRVLPRIGAGELALPALTARRDEYAELGRALECADRRLHSQQADLVATQAELNRFKTTLDQTLDCVFMFTPDDLRFFYTNAGAVRQVGYSPDELKCMTVLDIKPEFDEARFRQLIAPLIDGARDSVTFETMHRHKDGSLIPVEIFLQYIAPDDDDRGRFVAIVRDISERKRTERELEQHRQHLEELVAARSATIREQVSIINQTHDSVVTTDLEGVVTSWNGGARLMFGIPADQAIGRHISFVYPAEEHDFLQQQVIAPLQAKGEHETEVRMQRADGSEFFALLSLSMLYDDNGAAKGMVGYAVDISERKRREALLQSTTSKLQESNRELESFCHTVSHDLRAPLRAINGFSQLLAEDYQDRLDDTARDYLHRIRAGADNMGRIIDDLLELSRVARRELRFTEVNLSALAEQVTAELREQEPERKVRVDIQPGLSASGDEGLLRILMENLLGNAWKYTGRTPHARLEFGARESDAGPEFYIRDNGAGFDMRYADKLFGTFERLHHPDEFPGTGVGLATVHRIVTRHGGTITGEGQPGEGACFRFSLPAPGAAAQHGA
ncbi:MAG: PAS domain S-box protein [Thiogranum sp.]|nr:PAS domain S-box protein [Thiogranum sp.]